jgi:hypothetical protein
MGIADYHMRTIVCGPSYADHHMRTIICGPSYADHHMRTIICGMLKYYVNVERGNAADKLDGRNINVSFTHNSNVPIEVMVFIIYSDEIAIDVKTGLVTRHKN